MYVCVVVVVAFFFFFSWGTCMQMGDYHSDSHI